MCVCACDHCIRVLTSTAAVSQVSVAGVRCDLSAVDLQFRTPLHWAAVLGLSEIVTLLLERGADISAADGVGATAQHYAVSPHPPLLLLLPYHGPPLCRHRRTTWTV